MGDLVYLAHPVAGDAFANAMRAQRWLRWLHQFEPGAHIIAPWIAAIIAGTNDDNPDDRRRGLATAVATVERCDGIVLCGGVFSQGMATEQCRVGAWIVRAGLPGGWTSDLTRFGAEPPSTWAPGIGSPLAYGRRMWLGGGAGWPFDAGGPLGPEAK